MNQQWIQHRCGIDRVRCQSCGVLIEEGNEIWTNGTTHHRECDGCHARRLGYPKAPRPDLPIQPPTDLRKPRGDGCTGHAAAARLATYGGGESWAQRQDRERRERETQEKIREVGERMGEPMGTGHTAAKKLDQRKEPDWASEDPAWDCVVGGKDWPKYPEHAEHAVAGIAFEPWALTMLTGGAADYVGAADAVQFAEEALDLILAVRERRGW